MKLKAGRMGEFTITKDPTRAKGLRILMGPFTVYNKDNVEAAAKQSTLSALDRNERRVVT